MSETAVRRFAAAFGGVVAAGSALAIGYLVADLTGGPWPVDAVGVQVIDWAPGPVKDWAVRELGTADRPLLRFGICVTLAIVAAVAGVVGRRSPRLAVGLAGGLGLVGLTFAVFSRSAASGVVERLLPSVVTLVVAVVAMWLVVRRPKAVAAEQPDGFDRRQFLVTVSALAVAGAASFAATKVLSVKPGEALRARFKVPRPTEAAPPMPAGVQADVPGVSRFVTPNAKFYRVDTLLEVPQIDPNDWELRIHGMVDKEMRLSLADLVDRRLIERDITLTCVSNEVGGPYVGNARWIGVPIADVLAEAGVRSGADAVKSTSIDGLTIGTPLSALTDGRDAIFAVAMNGEPLPFDHGFPVRMVVPGLYGYVSATKWIVDFEVTRFADFSAYWTDRNWSEQAPIKTSSRIDVPKGFATLKAGPAVAAGVAWAQRRGIRSVEVQLDDGPWQPAKLATEDSIDTWRQWTFRWNATPGNHRLTVRATDAEGNVQTATEAPPRPNGSSGLHNTIFMVE
ncbi:molybdopterin-dependent oxidoreductase [Kribbella sandramycini]|uniref:DMSO/TMAO reductase YedYZ molybdopterin-dependent catalytic subunit n=1 Tax=Kribbella sandramycini TaxID=60450 RepID=A0A7Y4L5K9_9ACTN|nr:molybdopterin-dependent oxidoreductase [Kribbella sandramycini]MBB6567082.1 DMSO/TMAO reductase YedYZ molybdopterin-dependent catalytic subunit [Kribbella sandramycini]NOL44800.1 molybdopterin-dependent oxidoreductase [Kribbella sandramycini]